MTAATMAMGILFSGMGHADAETRTLKLYNLHTREKADITFKRNGSYDAAGLKKANQILRDWRRNEPTKMDPRLLDLVWEAYRASGSSDYIHVICGYRAPATNSMLRSRSKGVAEKSQHMLGKAMDFYIPDVNLKKLRNIGLKLQVGGVGYYPSSGSPFVHMDVGNVRHWPGISRQELASVFPNGKTLHVPSDGKPLPGYDVALASYKSRKKDGTSALALASAPAKSRSGGLLASLFGGGADEEEDSADVAASKPQPKKPDVKKPETVVEMPSSGKIKIVPPELANPAEAPAVADVPVEAPQTPEAIIAALPSRSIPVPGFAPRPKADVGVAEAAPAQVPFAVAAALPEEVPAAAEASEIVAANIPLPTWRPDYTAKLDKAEPAEDPVVLAMAAEAASDNGMTRSIMIGMSSSDEEEDEAAAAELPDEGPVLEAVRKDNEARLAVLATGATPKAAIASGKGDPAMAIGGSVKTTRKTARAKADDGKPDAKPLVVAVQPDASRWARYNGDYVADTKDAPEAPAVAFNIVRTAPSEVYAAGFQRTAEAVNPSKFSGKAVSFVPVARFASN